MFPLEVKHLLTAESIWKERTSLQRLKTQKHTAGTPASLRRGLATPPPTRLLDNTEHAVLLDRRGVFLNHLRPEKKTENPILPQTRNKQPEDESSKDRSADQSHFLRLVVVAEQRKWADRRDGQQTLRDQPSGGTRRTNELAKSCTFSCTNRRANRRLPAPRQILEPPPPRLLEMTGVHRGACIVYFCGRDTASLLGEVVPNAEKMSGWMVGSEGRGFTS